MQRSIAVLEATREHLATGEVDAAIEALVGVLGMGLPLLVCGNGGSAADAMHITGELVGRFLLERRALKVLCLADNPAVLTAWSNDYSFADVFARQVEAYGEPGGALLGLSTSGNSANVIRALERARALGMITIGLTGAGGGRMAALCDHLLDVPSTSTPLIQQAHLCLYHHLCAQIERRLFGAATVPDA